MTEVPNKSAPPRVAGAAWVLPVLLAAAFGAYVWLGVAVLPGQPREIWIEAARPVSIEYPFELVEVGESGEMGLSIGAKVGRGWLNEAGGVATYSFYAGADATYALWAYSLWHDECANAIYAQIDDSEKAVLGNDPVLGKWHWCRGFEIPLKRGFHLLRLSNHDDNVALQRLYLVDSRERVPSGEVSSVTLFLDNFNGCDHGNFRLWKTLSGQWTVNERERQDRSDNLLRGKSADRALLMLPDRTWDEYTLDASARTPDGGREGVWSGICFGATGESSYWEVRWSEQSPGDCARLAIVKRRPSEVKVVAAREIPWKSGEWHELRLNVTADGLVVTIDGGEKFSVPLEGVPRGGIGLSLEGDIETCFDNVRVWKPTQAGKK